MTISSSFTTTTTPHTLPSGGHGPQQNHHHHGSTTRTSLSHDDRAMIQTALAMIVVQRRRQQRQLASMPLSSSSSSSFQQISLPTTGKRPFSSHALELPLPPPPPHRPNHHINIISSNQNHPLVASSSSSVTTLKKNAPLPLLPSPSPPHCNHQASNTTIADPFRGRTQNDGDDDDYWKRHLQHLLLVLLHQEQEAVQQLYQKNQDHSLYLHFACQWEQLLLQRVLTTTMVNQTEQHPVTEEIPQVITQWLYEQWTRPRPPVTAVTTTIPSVPSHTTEQNRHPVHRHDDDDDASISLPPSRPKTPPHLWSTIWQKIVSMKPHVFCHTSILSLLLRLILPNDNDDNQSSSSSLLPTWPRIHYFQLLDELLTRTPLASFSPHQRHQLEQMIFFQQQRQQWSSSHPNDQNHPTTGRTGRHVRGNRRGSTSSSWYSVADLAHEYEAHNFPLSTTTRANDDFGETVLLIHGLIHWSERMNDHHDD